MILFFRDGKWNYLSQKKYMEIWFFLQMFWKYGFSKKKKLHWNEIFLVSPRKMAFPFPENLIFFLYTESERWSFSKNAWKYDVFCIFAKDGISFLKLSFCLKKAKMILSRKIHLKMTFPASLKKMILNLEKMILEI